jgi:hypothetical protein
MHAGDVEIHAVATMIPTAAASEPRSATIASAFRLKDWYTAEKELNLPSRPKKWITWLAPSHFCE